MSTQIREQEPEAVEGSDLPAPHTAVERETVQENDGLAAPVIPDGELYSPNGEPTKERSRVGAWFGHGTLLAIALFRGL
jgi:hypothetical protein